MVKASRRSRRPLKSRCEFRNRGARFHLIHRTGRIDPMDVMSPKGLLGLSLLQLIRNPVSYGPYFGEERKKTKDPIDDPKTPRGAQRVPR